MRLKTLLVCVHETSEVWRMLWSHRMACASSSVSLDTPWNNDNNYVEEGNTIQYRH